MTRMLTVTLDVAIASGSSHVLSLLLAKRPSETLMNVVMVGGMSLLGHQGSRLYLVLGHQDYTGLH